MLKCFRCRSDAKLPTKAYGKALGYDLYAAEETIIDPGQVALVPTGLKMVFPTINGIPYGGIIKDRSGTAKQKLFTAAGVIDNDYRGEVFVMVYNPAPRHTIKKGEKVAQMILVQQHEIPVHEIWEMPEDTERGEKGFGSSGV